MTEGQSKRIHAIVYSNDSRTELAERIVALEDENAKLWELVREMYGATLVSCGECWIGKAFDPAECDNENCGNRKNYLAMRELRIEVAE